MSPTTPPTEPMPMPIIEVAVCARVVKRAEKKFPSAKIQDSVMSGGGRCVISGCHWWGSTQKMLMDYKTFQSFLGP